MSTFDPNASARPDSGLFGLDDSVDSARVVIIPMPFDATTSYHHGAARGPAAILRASHQVDLYDVDTGRPYAAGIHMLPLPPSVQAWNATASRDAQTATDGEGGGVGAEELAVAARLAVIDSSLAVPIDSTRPPSIAACQRSPQLQSSEGTRKSTRGSDELGT